MKSARILVTRVAYELGRDVFETAASETLSFEIAPEEEEPLAEMVKATGAAGVVVAAVKYVGPLYESVPRGGIIARFGVGHDGIDDAFARKQGIYLTNAPGALDQSVAENAMFLIGSLARGIPSYTEAMRAGTWSPCLGTELHSQTLSIIGFGRIGRNLANIASNGFGMKIVACDVAQPDVGFDADIEFTTSIDEAMSRGLFCSLHLPIMESTKGIISRERLALMPNGSYLINTARGAVVDENALFDALSSGHLAGAGLDAFTNEPYQPLDPTRDLRTLPNVVMTPHVSSNTRAAVRNIAIMCVENVRALLDGRISDMNVY